MDRLFLRILNREGNPPRVGRIEQVCAGKVAETLPASSGYPFFFGLKRGTLMEQP